jgi:hypothetical protein
MPILANNLGYCTLLPIFNDPVMESPSLVSKTYGWVDNEASSCNYWYDIRVAVTSPQLRYSIKHDDEDKASATPPTNIRPLMGISKHN